MQITDTHVWWYYWLDRVNKDLNLSIDIENFVAKRPNLGIKIPKTYMYEYIDKQRLILGAVKRNGNATKESWLETHTKIGLEEAKDRLP